MNANFALVVGRLADDIEYTPADEAGRKSARAVGRLISNRPDGSHDVFRFSCYGNRADDLAKYARRGKELLIEGTMRLTPVRRADGRFDNPFFEIEADRYISYGYDAPVQKEQGTTKVPPAAAELPTLLGALRTLVAQNKKAAATAAVNLAPPEEVAEPTSENPFID